MNERPPFAVGLDGPKKPCEACGVSERGIAQWDCTRCGTPICGNCSNDGSMCCDCEMFGDFDDDDAAARQEESE